MYFHKNFIFCEKNFIFINKEDYLLLKILFFSKNDPIAQLVRALH